ncbi:MAG: tRNA pseudouridine(55) synthase TruB, partial [Gammaproteobacteria bacterium]|nr:tRNA pseudouridine(55) synthase TruB [Gammaproteobacteria bacterium]
RSLMLTPAGADAIRIRATVSKGTYIRTLGEDIGEALGCGAHLIALRRVSTGPFDESRCVTLADLEAMDEDERLAQLLPTESLVADHLRVMLGAEDAGRFLSGLRRRGDWADASAVAVFGPAPTARGAQSETPGEAFLGTAHIQGGELIPGRLLNPIEIQQTPLTEPTP